MKPDIPIAISTTEDDEEEYICNICQCILSPIPDNAYFCYRCQKSFYPNEIRKTSKLDPGDGAEQSNETLVSYMPDPLDEYYGRKKPEYKGGIGELYKTGHIQITSYEERGGDGRIMKSYNAGSRSSSSSNSGFSSRRAPLAGYVKDEGEEK